MTSSTCWRKSQLIVSKALYPIYTKPGTHGGVYIAKDYYLGKQYLVEEEKSLLEKLSKSVCQEEALLLKAIIKKFGKTDCVEGRR